MDPDYRVPSVRQIRSRLRLRHLDLLEALYAAGSVHKAAAQLGMTQPAASKLLVELEEAFGVPLFIRSRRGIAPTPYGTALVQKAGVLLADLEGAREEIAAITRGAKGRVRAGVLQVAQSVLVPRALARMHEENPGVTVMLHEGTSDLLLAGLARGELDCVIGRLMQGSAQTAFRTEVLYEEPIYIVARVGHPLARSTRITAATLARQAWILPPPDAPLRQRIDAYFAEQGLALDVPLAESVSLLANEILLRSTDVLCAMPRGVAQHYARLGVLTILAFQPPWILPPVGVVIRADVAPAPALERFLQAVRQDAARMREQE
ncbi:HTH-type transcriptional regulator GbpR [Pigmentiphaga humi]|uniref:HTH-type transcriptional regulator GbpR n=1 Tax=Pigmentiphaga humi TaxID=2478468 RepID=A0A3P4AWN5_9BURK|nr:LysR substrate-binding domain-containing protein [Pigmentiphaga humi]VCU68447.1 HTH-type transcriptional regulator GbpR [Pigmentiphaga humi]